MLRPSLRYTVSLFAGSLEDLVDFIQPWDGQCILDGEFDGLMSMHSLSLSMFSMLIWKWMTGRNTPKGNYGKGNGMINSMVHLFVPDLLL